MKISSVLGAIVAGWLLGAAPLEADEVRFIGDRVVGLEEEVHGDLVAMTGDLIIRGRVTGSVIAYVGDVTLDSTAVISGDVIAKRGRVYRAPGAQVTGNVIQGRIPGVGIGREESSFTTLPERKPKMTIKVHSEGKHRFEFDEEADLKVAYTKVDGLYLGLDINSLPFSDYGMRFRTFLTGGYAFASHTWQGRGGFGLGVLPQGQLELSVDAYHLSYTEDSWYISDMENSLAAFFLHEDFRDYYLQEGFGSTLSWLPSERFQLSARYQAEQEEQLENATDWALFGGAKAFIPNLPIAEGMLREFVFGVGLDSRDDEQEPECGWKLEAQVEITNPEMASDFDYRRAILDVRRYQPLGDFINLDLRARVGNSEGLLPGQKRFYLGGPSSLSGFGLKEFSGKEFALGNAEIRLHDDREDHRDNFFSDLGLLFFAEVGLAADEPLANFHARDWASDVGVGISAESGSIRLQLAKRTDRSDDAYVWMFRIQRPF